MNVQGYILRKLTATSLCLALSVSLTGCFHKRVRLAPLPPTITVVDTEPVSDSIAQIMVEPPDEPLPDLPIAAAAAKPHRERRHIAPKTTTPAAPNQLAVDEEPADVAAIGDLTTGSDATPQRHQQALDLIATNDKRINALRPDILRNQRSQISKIKNFQKQARQALDSGDSEGAMTLATKAKLLLDDLDKPSGGI